MKKLKHYVPLLIRTRARKVPRGLLRASRLLSRKPRSLPHFIIIGAQKSGTSSLYYFMAQHPRIFSALFKEVHFFDNNYAKGTEWYRSHFPLTRDLPTGSITGEASPSYIVYPLAPGRIHELVPDVKLIAILRNPTERAISNYFHGVMRGQERRPIMEALSADDGGRSGVMRLKNGREGIRGRMYKSRGLYKEQLERYLRYFSREQLLVLKSEDFLSGPQESLATVFDFLGVDASFKVRDLKPRNVATNRTEVAPEVMEYLNDWFRSPNRELYELLGRDFGW